MESSRELRPSLGEAILEGLTETAASIVAMILGIFDDLSAVGFQSGAEAASEIYQNSRTCQNGTPVMSIPGNSNGQCSPLAFVFIFGRDSLTRRLQETYLAAVHCRGTLREIVIMSDKWDTPKAAPYLAALGSIGIRVFLIAIDGGKPMIARRMM